MVKWSILPTKTSTNQTDSTQKQWERQFLHHIVACIIFMTSLETRDPLFMSLNTTTTTPITILPSGIMIPT